MGGARCFLSLIDDMSRKVWIHLLKTKDEALSVFNVLKLKVENQTGLNVKNLRTCNDLEFVYEEFNNFCKEKEIIRHKTVRGTPHHNGLAKRMNITILEKVRCMLLSFGCTEKFRDEAAKIACYLINGSLSSALEFKTPKGV